MFLRKQLAYAFLVLFSAWITPVALQSEEATVRILGVGNSFTQNSTRFLPEIIRSDETVSADIAMAYIGGSPLDLHVRLAEEHEADPEAGKRYRYALNGSTVKDKAALKEILQDQDWDYVTIQQVSGKSYKLETFYPYAGQLVDYIRKYAPEAEIVIHETWPHSIDSTRTQAWNLHPDDMYAQLHAAYKKVGEEFAFRIIPVGTAFQNAKQRPLWNYQATTVDVDSLRYPEDKDRLPDESKSLHRIFHWKKSADGEGRTIGNDGYHANANGEYLGALVWYGFFFGKNPEEVSYKPASLSEAQAESLREVARETLAAHATEVDQGAAAQMPCCAE